MDNKEQTHKRRKRYKGTHPKSYKDKYKELQPEKYSDTIEKVIQKGSTPAGMHIPIFVDRILEFFDIKPNQIGFDATLGYGGHTLEMLKSLGSTGHIHATDVDPIEILRTKDRLLNLGFDQERLTIYQMSFSSIDKVVASTGCFDFILADLGVSSMQIDNPDRGFSYKNEGPLDLRFDPKNGISASDRLSGMSRDEISGMFIENADEPHAQTIAKAIVSEKRKGKTITTTRQLREIIFNALRTLPGKIQDDEIKKSCQRCFQALRIDVNNEYQTLYDFLEKLPNSLKSGGKVAILSFHSGEDRLVKKSFQHFKNLGVYSEIAPGPLRPSIDECQSNSRAKSTKLRWAIKASK